ncbi:MAG: DUF6524 family protein [Pseudomonadota bacterium]|nr:DUF6524 family protein [Pseudomonadota bacterium]
MQKQGVTWFGVFVRFLMALVLVYATYNPEGWSYFHWAERAVLGTEGSGSTALVFLAGTVLLIGWVVFLNATRRSLGLVGVVLAAALCGGVYLALHRALHRVGRGLRGQCPGSAAPGARDRERAVGMSWAHLRQRLTGQVSTDEVD